MGERFYGYFKIAPELLEQALELRGEGRLVTVGDEQALVYIYDKCTEHYELADLLDGSGGSGGIFSEYGCGSVSRAEAAAMADTEYRGTWRPAAEQRDMDYVAERAARVLERRVRNGTAMAEYKEDVRKLLNEAIAQEPRVAELIAQAESELADVQSRIRQLRELHGQVQRSIRKSQADLEDICLAGK